MSDKVQRFKEKCERLNKIVLSRENLDMKRFFALDSTSTEKAPKVAPTSTEEAKKSTDTTSKK